MKQAVSLNFSQGINNKVDPWQLPFGEFESLVNSIYQKGGLLEKRDGYGLLNSTTPTSSYITTLNNNLLSIGTTVNAYSSSLGQWISKGTLEPCSLSVLPLVRNNLNQSHCDTAISNGLALTVLKETGPLYKYVISDAVTGQNIVAPSSIPLLATGTVAGTSRVFVVGNYFLIVTPVTVSGSTYLQYVSIPVTNPTLVSAAQNVTSQLYVAISTNPGWDGVVSNDKLVIAYNSTTGAQGVHVASLTAAQVAANSATTTILAFNNAAYIGSLVSVCVDQTVSPNILYISFWNNSTTNLYTCAVYTGFGTITQQFAPVVSMATIAGILNVASGALSSKVYVFAEIAQNYTYDSSIPTHRIFRAVLTSAGSVTVFDTAINSLGLASKGFVVDGKLYFLGAYQSPYQPSYFLIDGINSSNSSPIVVAKLAYENGGGYLTLGLPSVTVTDDTAQIPYLIKDLVEALSTVNSPEQTTTGGVYSQTGINLASFTLGTSTIDTAEIASNVHISGGFLSHFDGYLPVEHNFFLWPDSIEVTGSGSGGSMSAQTYFYQATYEWSDNQGNVYRSAPSIPVSVTTTGATSSVTVNVPTLRVTMKIANPVKIVIYRLSTATQVYNQVTSISSPTLNDPSNDSIAFVDTQADATIIGNNIIYTTGGVVENVNAPSTSIMTLFDTRLWMVDAEDPNLLWVSKQVIETTPVDMSDLFTIYVAPNLGTVQSTGPIRGMAPMDDKIILFKKNAIYYINGVGPNDLGSTSVGCSLGNYSQPIFITSVIGSENQQSLVLTQDGLMFQSDKGIWLLRRDLQTEYIGAAVEDYNSSTVTSAEVIPDTNRVLFTLDTGEMLMYDYYFRKWGVFEGASAVSSCIYNNLHTILTPYGQILQQTPGIYLDNTKPVLRRFKTSWNNLASLQGYERFYDMVLLAKYLSPHFLQVEVAYDYNPSPVHQVTIRPTNFSASAVSPFGVPVPFGSPGNREQWRIDAKRQLCESFQLSVQEVFDPSQGVSAGAGFTMSGISLTVGIKKGQKPIRNATSAGFQ